MQARAVSPEGSHLVLRSTSSDSASHGCLTKSAVMVLAGELSLGLHFQRIQWCSSLKWAFRAATYWGPSSWMLLRRVKAAFIRLSVLSTCMRQHMCRWGKGL